ncbi:hypothetical protein EV147_1795 [Cupriavidus agavae]|uniref:Uncharacterized protein n=2 Tax=Cupriavidus agavae TaxID=1001822 RepID=A0A4Q7S8I6_9BURK|nr:hypothetical protein EV147_1795 [Cupriavidus agavae]
MKYWPILFLFALPSSALGFVADAYCFISGGEAKGLEFRSYYDREIEWSGAVVKYENASTVIPLILKSRHVEILDPDRPYEVTRTWWEVVGGRFTGEYTMTSQGAMIYNFSYKNYRSRKVTHFSMDPNFDPAAHATCPFQKH